MKKIDIIFNTNQKIESQKALVYYLIKVSILIIIFFIYISLKMMFIYS